MIYINWSNHKLRQYRFTRDNNVGRQALRYQGTLLTYRLPYQLNRTLRTLDVMWIGATTIRTHQVTGIRALTLNTSQASAKIDFVMSLKTIYLHWAG